MTTVAPIEVTPLAAQKLAETLQQNGEDGSMLRVMVMPGAHGNFQYVLGVENEAKDGDHLVETDAVNVLIDSDSLPLIQGAQIDYVEGLMRSGFVISNPNAPQGDGCGCGGGGGGCGGGGGGGCGCGGGGGGGDGGGGDGGGGGCGCGGGGGGGDGGGGGCGGGGGGCGCGSH